jgi:hypothetical protein
MVSAIQIFPVTHAWNEDVANRPLLPNSAAMISQIASDFAANRRQLRGFYEMNFVLVPDAQPLVGIGFDLPPESYPDESDPSPYPIPLNMPVEGWPRVTGTLTLAQWQQDLNNDGGDRHAIIVQPGRGSLWEMWRAQFTNNAWHAANGAKWDLNSTWLAPAGLDFSDVAGLPMLGGLVPRRMSARDGGARLPHRGGEPGTNSSIPPRTGPAALEHEHAGHGPASSPQIGLPHSRNVERGGAGRAQGVEKYGVGFDNGNFFPSRSCRTIVGPRMSSRTLRA